jgi:K+-sensing histidine kinase KdpD
VLSIDGKKVEFYSNEILSLLQMGKSPDRKQELYDFIKSKHLIENDSKLFQASNRSFLTNSKLSSTNNLILSITDVTEVNELSNLRHESSIKTNLMQTLRHEIRTPLTGIICLITSLKKILKPKLDAESKQLVSAAIYSCNMISNLLNNFTVARLLGLCFYRERGYYRRKAI